MTVQKQPVTASTVGEAIFQCWRNGQNATVEVVMKALGSTHRQKVNNLMAEGRSCAAEMIQTREAEAQLKEDFPSEAFEAIRSWAKQVAEIRLTDWENALKARELALHDEQQAMQTRLQSTQQQLAGLEVQNATLQNQLTEAEKQADKNQAALQAKCDGLEHALADARERAGQAEARLDVTSQALKTTQADLAEQKQTTRKLAEQCDELNQTNKQQSTQLIQLTQQLESHKVQAAERDRNYQTREAAWLTERDERIRSETESTQLRQQLQTRLETLQAEFSALQQQQNSAEQAQASLKADIRNLEQAQAITLAQLESERSGQEKKDRRLIELERQNAALQAELARAGEGAEKGLLTSANKTD
ncbi:hypothetical protein [Reinekea marinisedimentorum]|uniref:Plasmid replication DNA-binding protein KfrA n=1 Tax=Reinekea marinisedimentorum TaxID=230495 RepID=A0A4R3IAJ3_9GAMM|nr:hypothetical protein [Reinekea marinisedimentorum]TCS42509.1 hypothetical protein BCF53_103170 [Reinekea marinisedimentorum]